MKKTRFTESQIIGILKQQQTAQTFVLFDRKVPRILQLIIFATRWLSLEQYPSTD